MIKVNTPQNINNLLNSAQIWGNIIHLSYSQNDDSFLSLIPQVDAYSDEFFLNNKMPDVFYASTPRNPKTVDKILHNIKTDNKEKGIMADLQHKLNDVAQKREQQI